MHTDNRTKSGTRTLIAMVAIGGQLALGFTGTAATAAGAQPLTAVPTLAGAALSSASAIELLAGNGIVTVANQLSTAPLAPVASPVGQQFTQAQVADLAQGAADGSGLTGATLDHSVPVGPGAPPFSYLLAAWVSTGRSSGAAAVRAMMGTQNWAQAPALVFPTIALPLFTADAVSAMGTASSAPATTSERAVAPAGGLARGRTAMGLFDSPCSTVTNFVQETLDKVFENLKLGPPSGSSVVAKVGSFFVALWNVAVSLAQSVVNGLVKAKGLSVVNAVVAIAGEAFALAEIVSSIVPWSAKVTAVPPSVALGGNPGSFKAVIGNGAGASYPPFVQDCAQALKITLPSFSAKGSKATWAVSGPISPTSTTAPVLDSQGANTLNYITGLVPCTPLLPADEQKARATISLTRSAVAPVQAFLGKLVGDLAGPAGGLVSTVLKPLLAQIAAKLGPLSQLSATGTVSLTKPTGNDKAQSSCPCLLGSWKVVDETVSLAHLSGGAGATWTVRPDGDNLDQGTTEVDYAGSQPLVGSAIGLKIQYSGSETDSYSVPPAELAAASGTWTVKAVSGDVKATTTVGGQTKTAPVPFDPGVAFTGTWACQGDDMSATYSGVGETVSLTRTSHYQP